MLQLDNEGFVRQAYRQLLRREPEPAARRGFLRQVELGQRVEVLQAIVESQEFRNLLSKSPRPRAGKVLRQLTTKKDDDLIYYAYLEVLGREPETVEVSHHLRLIQHGLSELEFLQTFLLSPEFSQKIRKRKSQQKNIGVVANRLRAVLNTRQPLFVRSLYRELLGRRPEHRNLTQFARLRRTVRTPKLTMIKTVVTSDSFTRYLSRVPELRVIDAFRLFWRLPNSIFLQLLYRECLGRKPDEDGIRHHENQLNAGVARLQVLQQFLLSTEARQRYRNAQMRATDLLNGPIRREPSGEHLRPEVPIYNDVKAHVTSVMQALRLPFESAILVKTGGMGDVVQLTPIAKALKVQDARRPVIAVVERYGSLLQDHPYIDAVIEATRDQQVTVKSLLGLAENVFDLRYVSRVYGTWNNPSFSYHHSWDYEHFPESGKKLESLGLHVNELMLRSTGLSKYAKASDVYVTPAPVKQPISGDYVVVCNSFGSPSGALKEWPVSRWEPLLTWLQHQGIKPVQLGVASDPLISSNVLDLRGVSVPRESAGYLKQSCGYIGGEGGLFHLAKAVNVPAVVIFASTPESGFAYPDTYVVTRRLCRPCMWEEPWVLGKCVLGYSTCFNLPGWKDVADAVSHMLQRG